MPKSEASSLLGDYHRIGGALSPLSSYGSGDLATPRSPFDTGFPMMFNSPVPSPRPHRLSFAFAKDDPSHNRHVFLTLLMSVVGAGMLTIPYTFILTPSWQAVLGIIFVGFSMAFSATALLNTHVALSQEQEAALHIGAGKRFTSFQSIAIIAGGDIFGYIVSVVTAIGIYGGCVGSIRIIRDISPFLISELYAVVAKSETRLSETASLQWSDYFLCGTFVVIVFPLCLLKNLSGLRLSSYLGFAFSLYVVAAIIYRSSHALSTTGSSALVSGSNDTATGVANSTQEALMGSVHAALSTAAATATTRPESSKIADTVIVGGPYARFSQSMSLFNYAFMLHLNLLPLFIQLRGSFAEPLQKSRRKMSDYILGVTVFCTFLYLVLGLFAKKLFHNTIRGNILLNLENDPIMEIPLVAAYLTAIAGFPLLFHPLRSVIEELIYSTSVSEIPFATRLGGTSFLLLSQLLLAILVPGIEVVFAFTGASSCVLICFLFPAVMYTRLFPWRHARGGKLWVVALWGLVAIFTVVGAIATCVDGRTPRFGFKLDRSEFDSLISSEFHGVRGAALREVLVDKKSDHSSLPARSAIRCVSGAASDPILTRGIAQELDDFEIASPCGVLDCIRIAAFGTGDHAETAPLDEGHFEQLHSIARSSLFVLHGETGEPRDASVALLRIAACLPTMDR